MGTTSAEAPSSLYGTSTERDHRNVGAARQNICAITVCQGAPPLSVGFLFFAKGRREIVMKSDWEIITCKVMRYGIVWYGGEA
jgi:hypothetical protein